jgi:hypothetical protein
LVAKQISSFNLYSSKNVTQFTTVHIVVRLTVSARYFHMLRHVRTTLHIGGTFNTSDVLVAVVIVVESLSSTPNGTATTTISITTTTRFSSTTTTTITIIVALNVVQSATHNSATATTTAKGSN